MFVVVSYDIPDDKRRLKVMKMLRGFGHHAQYSVFECRLKRRDLRRLQKGLKALIREEEDDVRLYLLCEQCVPRMVPMGKAKVAPEADYRIV
jgi:CRISPR-associated protein Cas2